MININTFECYSIKELKSIFFRYKIEGYQISKGSILARIASITFEESKICICDYKTTVLSKWTLPNNKITFILIINVFDELSKFQDISIKRHMLFCLGTTSKIFSYLVKNSKIIYFQCTREELKFLNIEYIIDSVIYPIDKKNEIISNKIISLFNRIHNLSNINLKKINEKILYEHFFSLYLYLYLYLNKKNIIYLQKDYESNIAETVYQYIKYNANYEIKMKTLCQLTQKSARTLEREFKKKYHITIQDFIKIHRLNEVRHKLLAGLDNNTITEVAYECGFLHLSRFSQKYKELFAELPSETYKRLQKK